MPPEITEETSPHETANPEEDEQDVNLSELMTKMKKEKELKSPGSNNGKKHKDTESAKPVEPKKKTTDKGTGKDRKMKGLDDFFSIDEEETALTTDIDGSIGVFRYVTETEPETAFFMQIHLSNENGNDSKRKLTDFKRMFLFTKKMMMIRERHSTEKGVFVPIRNRLISLRIDEHQDHLSVSFVLEGGTSISLRAFDEYSSFLHDVILKKYLAPNLRS